MTESKYNIYKLDFVVGYQHVGTPLDNKIYPYN